MGCGGSTARGNGDSKRSTDANPDTTRQAAPNKTTGGESPSDAKYVATASTPEDDRQITAMRRKLSKGSSFRGSDRGSMHGASFVQALRSARLHLSSSDGGRAAGGAMTSRSSMRSFGMPGILTGNGGGLATPRSGVSGALPLRGHTQLAAPVERRKSTGTSALEPSDTQLAAMIEGHIARAKKHGIDGDVEDVTPEFQLEIAQAGYELLGPSGIDGVRRWAEAVWQAAAKAESVRDNPTEGALFTADDHDSTDDLAVVPSGLPGALESSARDDDLYELNQYASQQRLTEGALAQLQASLIK